MSFSSKWLLTALLLGSLVAWFSLLAPSSGQQPATGLPKDVELTYAKAQLQLAQANLAHAQSVNKDSADTIPAPEMLLLKGTVESTQRRVDQLEGKPGSEDSSGVSAAKLLLASQEDQYQRSLEANKINPGTYSATKMAQLKAQVDVARARVAMAAATQSSPELNTRWQLEHLQDQINEMKSELRQLRATLNTN